ncbi:MAG: hypothetical protein EBX37_06835 [Alphaproteobacteria bacterium]|nr:hypothetical protein [Alphaproteobacteria bacterium]
MVSLAEQIEGGKIVEAARGIVARVQRERITIALIVGVVIMVSGKMAFPFNGAPPFLSPAPFYQMMAVGLNL